MNVVSRQANLKRVSTGRRQQQCVEEPAREVTFDGGFFDLHQLCFPARHARQAGEEAGGEGGNEGRRRRKEGEKEKRKKERNTYPL